MSERNLPFVNILQSATCVPPNQEQPIALDIKVLPDKDIPPEPFFGIWLLDISGSMAGDRLRNAKESLTQQVKAIPEGSIFNLITFESEIQEVMLDVVMDDKTRKQAIEEIEKIEDRGTTALHSALTKGIEILRTYVRKGSGLMVKKIFLISDGDPTDVQVETGNDQDPNYEKYFLLAKEAREYKGSIDTIGALGEHNVYLLYEIAKQSTGKYIFASNEEELKEKMNIITEQTARIAFSQPSIKITSTLGDVVLQDMAQYKPTVIRMPFEKLNDKESKTFLRSFEAGDTYQFLIKGTLKVDTDKIEIDKPNVVLKLLFDFGDDLTLTKEVMIKYSNDPTKFKLNQDINKKYANVFSQAQEISDCTIRGDAEATQRIQGDETVKINN